MVELLEVPQLVDACARNGFHDEALELANFVNSLERRHLLATEVRSLNGQIRGGCGVVQSIVNEVHRTLISLRHQLLTQLTENTSLPKEIHILATLRKLDGLLIDRHISLERHDHDSSSSVTIQPANLSSASGPVSSHGLDADKYRDDLRQQLIESSETRLQMDFLEARTVWLEKTAEKSLGVRMDHKGHLITGENENFSKGGNSNSSAQTPILGPYGKAIEILESRRTSWFAVITQFNALFEDSRCGAIATNSSTQETKKNGQAAQPLNTSCMIINAWATRQAHRLMHELRVLLPLIEDGSSLRAVLEQSLYFASRMSQVGCDFSGLVLPLYKDVLVDRITGELDKIHRNFQTILQYERIVFEGDDASREQVKQ